MHKYFVEFFHFFFKRDGPSRPTVLITPSLSVRKRKINWMNGRDVSGGRCCCCWIAQHPLSTIIRRVHLHFTRTDWEHHKNNSYTIIFAVLPCACKAIHTTMMMVWQSRGILSQHATEIFKRTVIFTMRSGIPYSRFECGGYAWVTKLCNGNKGFRRAARQRTN